MAEISDYKTIRDALTPQQRSEDMYMSIDPGFVHIRKIETILRDFGGMEYIDKDIKALPELPEWMKRVRIDHIYTNHIVSLCSALDIPTLNEALGNENGRLFSSIEYTQPTDGVWEGGHVATYIKPQAAHGKYTVRLSYDASRVTSDTVKGQLSEGSELAIIAQYAGREGDELIFHPLVIGAPWLAPKSDKSIISSSEAPWHSHEFFENFVEDFDEFSKVKDEPKPEDISIMKDISESAFKHCLGEIISEQTVKDWGGETSDHYTANIHLNGQRTTAAFLLKGPAKFSPMKLTHLGKNADQIYRLAQEPAQVLIVQHCHDILSPVRATLRAFAVRPGESRRYCLIDGRDSLRLIKAYDKLDRALSLSRKSK